MTDTNDTAESLALALGTRLGDELPRDTDFVLLVVRNDRVGFSSTLDDATARKLLAQLSKPPT